MFNLNIPQVIFCIYIKTFNLGGYMSQYEKIGYSKKYYFHPPIKEADVRQETKKHTYMLYVCVKDL